MLKTSTNKNRICLDFELGIRNNLINLSSLKTKRRITSVVLWLHVTKAKINKPKIKIKLNNIENSSLINVNLKYLQTGWNTINVTSLFTSIQSTFWNETNKVSLLIKCFKACSIGYTDNIFSSNSHDFDNKDLNIEISSDYSTKPLLFFTYEDEKLNTNKIPENNDKNINLDKSMNFCQNESNNTNKECCLNSYWVNFSMLNMDYYILYPKGFYANYCSGGCSKSKSKCFYYFTS